MLESQVVLNYCLGFFYVTPITLRLPKLEHLLHILMLKTHFMKLHYKEFMAIKLNIAIFKIQLFSS